MQFLMLFVIWLYAVCLFFLSKNKHSSILSRALLIPYVVLIPLLMLGFLSYELIISPTTFFIIIIQISIMVIVFQKIRHFDLNYYRPAKNKESIIFFILSSLLVIYMFYVMLDLKKSWYYLSSFDLNTLRYLHWNEEKESSVIYSVARSGAFILGINAYHFYKKQEKVKLFISFIALFLIVLENLTNAGRGLTMYVFLSILSVYVLYRFNEGKKLNYVLKKKHYFGIAFLLSFIIVIFPHMRNENYVDSYNKYLSFRHDVEISEWVHEQQFLNFLPTLAFSSQYFIQPIVKFTDHIENLNLDESYYLGQFNFRFLDRNKVRQEVEDKIRSQGYTAVNPWGTGARDLIIDFGYSGAFIFIFIVSLFFKFIFERSSKKQSIINNSLGSLCVLSCFLFYFVSPFRITIIFNTIVLCLFLKIIEKLTIHSHNH